MDKRMGEASAVRACIIGKESSGTQVLCINNAYTCVVIASI